MKSKIVYVFLLIIFIIIFGNLVEAATPLKVKKSGDVIKGYKYQVYNEKDTGITNWLVFTETEWFDTGLSANAQYYQGKYVTDEAVEKALRQLFKVNLKQKLQSIRNDWNKTVIENGHVAIIQYDSNWNNTGTYVLSSISDIIGSVKIEKYDDSGCPDVDYEYDLDEGYFSYGIGAERDKQYYYWVNLIDNMNKMLNVESLEWANDNCKYQSMMLDPSKPLNKSAYIDTGVSCILDPTASDEMKTSLMDKYITTKEAYNKIYTELSEKLDEDLQKLTTMVNNSKQDNNDDDNNTINSKSIKINNKAKDECQNVKITLNGKEIAINYNTIKGKSSVLNTTILPQVKNYYKQSIEKLIENTTFSYKVLTITEQVSLAQKIRANALQPMIYTNVKPGKSMYYESDVLGYKWHCIKSTIDKSLQESKVINYSACEDTGINEEDIYIDYDYSNILQNERTIERYVDEWNALINDSTNEITVTCSDTYVGTVESTCAEDDWWKCAFNFLDSCEECANCKDRYIKSDGTVDYDAIENNCSDYCKKCNSNNVTTKGLGALQNLVFDIGNIIFLIVTAFLGVKYIWGGVDSKYSVKNSLVTLVVAAIVFYGWNAVTDILNVKELLTGSTSATGYQNFATTIYNTIMYIVNVAAIGGIIYIGIKYMMAGADGKAEMKLKLIPVIMGIILVYGTLNFINVILDIVYTF